MQVVEAGIPVENERRRTLGELHQGEAEFIRDAQCGVQAFRPTAHEQGVELIDVGSGERVAADVVAVETGAPGAGVIKEEVGHGRGGAEKASIISATRQCVSARMCGVFLRGVFMNWKLPIASDILSIFSFLMAICNAWLIFSMKKNMFFRFKLKDYKIQLAEHSGKIVNILNSGYANGRDEINQIILLVEIDICHIKFLRESI